MKKLSIILAIIALLGNVYGQNIQNGWSFIKSMPSARENPAVVRVGNYIYAIGGSQITPTYYDQIFRYDIAKNSWVTMTTTLPSLWSALDADVIEGHIYVVGGNYFTQKSANTYEFDPIAEKLWTRSSLNKARSHMRVIAFDGRLYVFGGNIGGSLTKTVEEYTPSTDTWVYKKDMLSERGSYAACLYDDKIYIFGGRDNSGYTNKAEVYDPVNDSWAKISNLPVKLSNAVAEAMGDKIYIIAGAENASTTTNKCYVYDPANDSYTSFTALNTDRYTHNSATTETNIYVMGGYNRSGSGDLKSFETIQILAPNVIRENSNQKLNIYPNPTVDYIYFSVNPSKQSIIQIFDMYGKLVFEATQLADNRVDISSLPIGIYNVLFIDEGHSYTSRVIKLKE